MTVEEHGAGKQFFRFKIYPKVSRKWSFVLLLLIGLAVESGLDFFTEGGTVLIASICLATTAALLLWLMYRECAAPFAAILGSLESLDERLENEIGTSVHGDIVEMTGDKEAFADKGSSANKTEAKDSPSPSVNGRNIKTRRYAAKG